MVLCLFSAVMTTHSTRVSFFSDTLDLYLDGNVPYSGENYSLLFMFNSFVCASVSEELLFRTQRIPQHLLWKQSFSFESKMFCELFQVLVSVTGVVCPCKRRNITINKHNYFSFAQALINDIVPLLCSRLHLQRRGLLLAVRQSQHYSERCQDGQQRKESSKRRF